MIRPSFGGGKTVEFGPQHVWVLPHDRAAARQARGLVDGVCRGLPEDTVDTARLLVSELVANAVLHGSGSVVLAVTRHRGTLRVEVSDASTALPVMSDGALLEDHGAGLRLVDALASDWGTSSRGDGHPGKRVWFVLR